MMFFINTLRYFLNGQLSPGTYTSSTDYLYRKKKLKKGDRESWLNLI